MEKNVEQINKLRNRIKQNPERFKAMSKLCHLLMDDSKCLRNDESLKLQIEKEAFELAQKCVEISPNKSIGYGALSISSPTFEGRMEALRKAIELEEAKSLSLVDVTCAVGLAFALLRLLVEPRDEERNRSTKGVPKGSTNHPSKRDLSHEEKILYKKIKDKLKSAGNISTIQKENELSQSCLTLGLAHYRLGMFFRKLIPESTHRPSSLFHYKQSLQLLPTNDTIAKKCRFWLATFGEEAPDKLNIERCPEEYIVSLYSTFASKFDNLLVNKLKYETPSKLRKVVDKVRERDQINHEAKTTKLGADLGCGTGLSGVAFQDYVDELYGIDLSPEMIDKASARKCYKELFVGDLEKIFNVLDVEAYDLIIACDVFVYIGELRCIFESVHKHLCTDSGLFAFSTECLEESSGANGFVLHKCARFSHKKTYIEMLAKEVGFSIKILEKSVIRQNKGKDVEGLLVVLSRN